MAKNALNKIVAIAKSMRRKHPGAKWSELIKRAGAQYRAGSRGSSSRAKTSRGKSSNKKRKSARPAAPAPTVNLGVGSDTVASHLAAARQLLNDRLGRLEVRKFHASRKTDKRAIQKDITEVKNKLRRLS